MAIKTDNATSHNIYPLELLQDSFGQLLRHHGTGNSVEISENGTWQ